MIVFRNDAITIDQIKALSPDRILISPGPGYPKDAGICCQVIRELGPSIPIGGICLGMQCMFEVYGGQIGPADEIIHGKQSIIENDAQGFFKECPKAFKVTRYHSLVGLPTTLPSELEITSRVQGEETIMGVRHKTHKVEGVQFHPESILTEHGKQMIQNFLTL